jgi:lyso-ornithine lipid O-acyltransferase
MRRMGVVLKVAVFGLVFLALWGPQALSLRRNGPVSRRLPILLHRAFLRLFGVRVRVMGAPPEGPALMVVNHASWLDIPVLASLTPLSFVAKREVAGWPVVGLFARLQRCIFLDRTRRSATAAANARIAERLAEGDAIVLFPEGTSNDGNRVLPFRSSLIGAALAETVGRKPVVQPVAIAYVRRDGLPVTRADRPAIAWYGDMDLAPHLAAFARRGPIDAVVVWGEPIPVDAGSDRKRLTAQAEAAVRAARLRVGAG